MPRRTTCPALAVGRPLRASPLGVALAIAALCLRLVWPAPPAVGPADITALAGLGEHALCIAGPAGTEAAPKHGGGVPAPAGDHADHDHSLCCLWHAANGFVVPQIATVTRITFVGSAPLIAITAEFQPADVIGPARARGPPSQV